MDKDDIIRMAKKAGKIQSGVEYTMPFEVLERFANLVAAAEREACAKVCDKHAEMHRQNRQFTFASADDKCAHAIRKRRQ